MKRQWNVIRNILEHIEAGDLNEVLQNDTYIGEIGVTSEDYAGHIEILVDSGIIRNIAVRRDATGQIRVADVHKVFITMQGHDLLDAMRDKTLWNLIRNKAKQAGLSLSWEVIKACMPIAVRELLN